ncbi:MAG: hypothetical protein JWO82_736 [Akkermansiaceae bacterium]|nr:hypothetical protein [Akkermansiaceae bacterium]
MNRRVLLLTPLLIACGGSFDEPPPPLATYPQRVPGKGWLEVLEVAKPLSPGYDRRETLSMACQSLAVDFPKLTAAERLAKIDELVARNREGQFDAQTANVLTEMREMAADDPTVRAAADYLVWRCSDTALEWGKLGRKPAGRNYWDPKQYQTELAEFNSRKVRLEADLKEHLQSPPPELIPNFRIQFAAFKLLACDFPGVLEDFRRIEADFPGHPRAEVARFMRGRTLLAQSRYENNQEGNWGAGNRNLPKSRIDAVAVFQDYLREYPQGRFVADAHGWIGAAAADGGFYGEATGHQLDRLEVRASREVLRSVLRDTENLFTKIFMEGEDAPDPAALAATLPWDQLARHPEVARLFLSHALDPTATNEVTHCYEGDSGKLKFLQRRIVLPQPFARRSLELLGAALAKAGPAAGKDDPFTLQVLGWSALRDGHPERAVRLFDRALKIAKSDELLEGRAMAMTALRRHREAMASYDALFQDFPDSPLARPLRMNRAIARCRAGHAGEALVELLDLSDQSEHLEYQEEDTVPPTYDLVPKSELKQWIDTISQFAPLDQLAAPLKDLAPESPHAYTLRHFVRTRALARERFDLARLYLDPGQPPENLNEGYRRYDQPRPIRMDQAFWDRKIEPLAKATRAASRKGRRSARAELALGHHWRDLDGNLLFLYGEENLQRRENARLLGLGTKAIDAELDSAYRLFHARSHFLRAAAFHNPSTELAALEEANEVLPGLALTHRYRLARAVEMNDTALSARLVARIREIAPGSPQAARVVTWNFQPLAENEPWQPGYHPIWQAAPIILLAISDPAKSFTTYFNGYDEDNPNPRTAPPGPVALSQLTGEFFADGAVKEKLAGLRSEYDVHRSEMSKDGIFTTGAVLDDLDGAAALPEMTVDLFHRYAVVRLGGQAVPPLEGEWLPLKPFFAYRESVEKIGRKHVAGENTDDVVAMWENYLREFPGGPKTEAARLQLLRARVYQISPVPQVNVWRTPKPTSSRFDRGMSFDLASPPGDEGAIRKSLLADLKTYQKDYPRGRYRADVKQLSASLLADGGDYVTALERLSSLLDDPTHPELHQDAALRFAEIGLRLLDVKQRTALAKAFRRNPAVMAKLEHLVRGDTRLFQLRPMMKWLRN